MAAYSPRPETIASREVEDDVPLAEKRERFDTNEQLRNIIQKIKTFEKNRYINRKTLVIADDGKRIMKDVGEQTAVYYERSGYLVDRIFLDDFNIPVKYNLSERIKYTNENISPFLFRYSHPRSKIGSIIPEKCILSIMVLSII